MPRKKTGQEVPCVACGTMIYRSANYLARGHKRMTCASRECKSKAMMGEHNPFWGKDHDEDTLKRIREARRANPPKKTGPPKGYKHTPEALEKMRAAMKRRWEETRDKMLAAREHLKVLRPREELRYRRNFTEVQRQEWKSLCCAWCGSTKSLELDHIIPVSCGGENLKRNAQTLCSPCNKWKMLYVDRPLFLAGLGEKRA